MQMLCNWSYKFTSCIQMQTVSQIIVLSSSLERCPRFSSPVPPCFASSLIWIKDMQIASKKSNVLAKRYFLVIASRPAESRLLSQRNTIAKKEFCNCTQCAEYILFLLGPCLYLVFLLFICGRLAIPIMGSLFYILVFFCALSFATYYTPLPKYKCSALGCLVASKIQCSYN